MTQDELTGLVHLAGFATGVVLYALLAQMTLRYSGGRLPLLAAVLGMVWNFGSLIFYALHDFGLGQTPPVFTALSFIALGFLPAVVLHASIGQLTNRPAARAVVVMTYIVGTVAATLQLAAVQEGGVPARSALITLSLGYSLLVPAAVLAGGRHSGWQRSLTVTVLAAFAVSALHLGHPAESPDSWLTAVVGHHASLPLVLLILYQDYRVAFADQFLRRAISLMVLVIVAATLHVLIAVPITTVGGQLGNESLLVTATHVALWVTTALMYPVVAKGVRLFVDRVILDRTDYRFLRDDLILAISRIDSPTEVLRRTCQMLADSLGARHVEWYEDPGSRPSLHASVSLSGADRGSALVRVPTSDAPVYMIEIADLAAGRRLFSDDILLLESVASAAARRIDAVRVTEERFERDLREREITQLATEAELRALRAQLNPHFLFNTLTTIGQLMEEAPERARDTMYRLTDLLRAVLRRPGGEFTTLGEELEVIESYLAIEHARFEERLLVAINVPMHLRSKRIPPLLLQPLVENAVKHGIAPRREGGTVSILAELIAGQSGSLDVLQITIADNGTGFDIKDSAIPHGMGVGLSSVEHRLMRLYSGSASLDLTTERGKGTTVTIRLPLAEQLTSDSIRTLDSHADSERTRSATG